MFKHYLASALRHFARHKITTTANVLCLWFGLVAFSVSYGLNAYSKHMDAHHESSARTYFITQDSRFGSGQATMGPTPYSGFALAPLLQTQYPELESVARLTMGQEVALATQEVKRFSSLKFADPSLLHILDLTFSSGDRRNALRTPHSAIISDDLAKQLFGTTEPTGQTVLINNSVAVEITGVIKPSQRPAFVTPRNAIDNMNITMLASMDTRAALLENGRITDWGAGKQQDFFYVPTITYLAFRKDGAITPEQLSRELQPFADQHIPPESGRALLRLRPITEIGQSFMNLATQSHRTGVSSSTIIFAGGVLVLLVACLNYANLVSAQTASHLKELALLRTVGAKRGQIAVQAFVEALIVAISAAGLAVATLPAIVTSLRISTGIDYGTLLFVSMEFWLSMLCVTFGTAILAGSYPAWIAVRIRPAQALHSGSAPIGKRRAMRIIVVAQSAVATLLLVLSAVMDSQFKTMNAGAALTDDPLIVVSTHLNTTGVDRTLLMNELRRQNLVTAVSAISWPPGDHAGTRRTVMASSEPGARSWAVSAPSVDYDAFAAAGIPLLAGREFQRSIASDLESDNATGNVIIDTVLAEQYGWHHPQEAIGKQIFVPNSGDSSAAGIARTVVGVAAVRDLYPMSIGSSPARVYSLRPSDAGYLMIRIQKANIAGALAQIDSTWNQLSPNVPLQRAFLGERVAQSTKPIMALGKTSASLSILALLIAAMGIIGIAAHTINERKFEIGIRKSIGASSRSILLMLFKDFAKPILIAAAIAWPFAFVVSKGFLTLFAHPIDITMLPFIRSLLIGLIVTWLAVGGQAWRAARMNPATVLRHE